MAAITTLLLIVAAPNTSEWVELIGFSKDGRLAAYRRDVHERRDDGTHDQYSIIQTVDVASGRPVARFRATAIHRVSKSGRPLEVDESELLGAHPRFRDAFPNKRWKELEKRGGFAALALPPDGAEPVVTLHLDDDVTAQEQIQDGYTFFLAPKGAELGVGAIVEGVKVPVVLAHHRYEPAAGAFVLGRLQAFAAKSGGAVALVTIFMINDGAQPRSVAWVDVVRLAQPLAPRELLAARRSRRVEDSAPVAMDPFNARVGLDVDPSIRREMAAARKDVDPKERRQLEAVYDNFVGN